MEERNNKRLTIPKKVENEVLLKSGRRCCLCWALKGNSNVRLGQIAHLDHNPQNNEFDNLAFLCFDHHDKYDVKTSQSKRYKPAEVKSYRDKLYDAIQSWQKPPFDQTNVNSSRGIPDPHDMAPCRKTPSVSIHGNGNLVAGRDLNIVLKHPHKSRQPSPVIPGTVVEDHKKFNYIEYLIRRYNDFKKWDCTKQEIQMKYALIRVAYKRKMKCDVRHTPLTRFQEAVNFLQARIVSTRLGRIEHSKGNPLFETFEQFPG